MYTKYCTLDLNSFWEIHCLSVFPYKSLTYQSWPCHKLGQGHCKVIICINYDGPACPMLHTKFQGHRPFGSGEEDFWRVFTIYGRGGHLGHVTQIPGTNFRSPDLGRLHMKYGFNRPVVSEKKMFENLDDGWTDGMTLTFSDIISSFAHLVDHVYQVLYLRLK